MFGLGMQELIIILVVALIVIGPKKMPDLARGLGRAIREFRRATDDIKQNFDVDVGDLDPRSVIKSANAPPPPPKDDTTNNTPNQEKKAT